MTVFFGCLRRLSRSPLNLIFLLVFPLMFTVLSWISGEGLGSESPIAIGVADEDGTALSEALVRQMEARYTVVPLTEDGVSSALLEQDVSWVLRIPKGYQAALTAARVPGIGGVAIAVSDVQYVASATAETATRALLAIASGAEADSLEEIVSRWEEASFVEVTSLPRQTGWGDVLMWVSFHGWISMLTAFFLVRTVMTDRRGGLPERVGVLPVSRRKYTLWRMLAVFTLCEASTALMLAGVSTALAAGLPNAPLLFLVMSVYNLFSAGFSLCMFTLIRSDANTSMAVTMVTTLFAMLGGTYWPVEFMPGFMRRMAVLSPNYWLGDALAKIENITVEDYWTPLLVLLVFSAAAYLLAGLRRVERSDV